MRGGAGSYLEATLGVLHRPDCEYPDTGMEPHPGVGGDSINGGVTLVIVVSILVLMVPSLGHNLHEDGPYDGPLCDTLVLQVGPAPTHHTVPSLGVDVQVQVVQEVKEGQVH